MSDKQKAIVLLTVASDTCTAALSALKDLNVQDSLDRSNNDAPTLLSSLQKDLSSLLSLIYASTTKISLSLKPSSPTYAASFTPLQDISAHISAIAHCATLFDPRIHGATLTKEVIYTVKDVIEAVRSLLSVFSRLQNSGTPSLTGAEGEEYLIRTGAVHELIETARGPNRLSLDNLSAVRKKWKEDRASLEDGLKEVGEMIEDQDDEGFDEADDDGWDEFGLGSSKKLGQDEVQRAKKVETILRLTTLLHKRILLDILSPSCSPVPSNAHLDSLLVNSASLLVSSDDLVSTLYAPQDPTSIKAELPLFMSVIRALQSNLQPFFRVVSLEEQLEAVTISPTNAKEVKATKTDPQKWFGTCFGQIYKTCDAFTSTLESGEINGS